MRVIGILHFGLGEIGRAVARATRVHPGLASVAAVDTQPLLIGRTLGEVCGEEPWEPIVCGTLEEARRGADGALVAFHAAGSRIRVIEAQIQSLLEAGLNVVTTAEELIHPSPSNLEAADRLDAVARRSGVSLLAAGVNPGFLMDRLPAYVSSMCLGIRGVSVYRTVDLARRRTALRRKMGVSEAADDVRARLDAGSMGHVGLGESLRYLAAGLGWQIDEIHETLAPVIAARRVERVGEVVEAGQVAGIEHRASAQTADGRRIELSLTMRIDAESPRDEIRIDADPPVELVFPAGLDGDRATVASVLNAAAFVADATPGYQRRLVVPTGSEH